MEAVCLIRTVIVPCRGLSITALLHNTVQPCSAQNMKASRHHTKHTRSNHKFPRPFWCSMWIFLEHIWSRPSRRSHGFSRSNPILGIRGCDLGISCSVLYSVSVRSDDLLQPDTSHHCAFIKVGKKSRNITNIKVCVVQMKETRCSLLSSEGLISLWLSHSSCFLCFC